MRCAGMRWRNSGRFIHDRPGNNPPPAQLGAENLDWLRDVNSLSHLEAPLPAEMLAADLFLPQKPNFCYNTYMKITEIFRPKQPDEPKKPTNEGPLAEGTSFEMMDPYPTLGKEPRLKMFFEVIITNLNPRHFTLEELKNFYINEIIQDPKIKIIPSSEDMALLQQYNFIGENKDGSYFVKALS